MARIVSVEKLGYRTWRYTWAPGTAPYRIVYRGHALATTLATTIDYAGGDNVEPPALEVCDAADGPAPSELCPPYATIQFRGYPWAARYVVSRLVAGAWVEQETIPETGCGYYTHASPALPDAVLSQFRVVAYDPNGVASDPVYLHASAIGHPEPPAVALAFSAGTLTVSAR